MYQVIGWLFWSGFCLSLGLILYQVIRQQGRILLRLDEIERSLSEAGLSSVGSVGPSNRGISEGDPFEAFEAFDLNGKPFSLEDFRGRRMLIVYWSASCGFCELIAKDLAWLYDSLMEEGVSLVLASWGGSEANRRLALEAGLKCPILLVDQEHSLIQGAFRFQGTPSAYLVDAEGRVARQLVVGGDAILSMAKDAIGGRVRKKRLPGERPLSTSRLVRDGLKPGTAAPLFRLADLRGEMISLEDYRGRRVILIFTDPHCGPCEELAPHLGNLQGRCHEEGVALIVVARGELEENRRKAEANGFEFPVVLQERWKLSQEYGIFAVPVAFLIDEQGVIALPVARGVQEILALFPQEVPVG